MNDEIITIKDLSCGYQDKIVLNSLNMCVNRGDIIGIAGPNGAGKTTLIRAITKNIHLSKGSILISGRDIDTISARELAKIIAVVPQETLPSFRIIVREMIGMGRTPYIGRFGFLSFIDDQKIDEVSQLTGIHHLMDRYFDELSGGEKQLVVFTRCLVQEPEIMLLDEVTNNLDIEHTIRLFEIIRKINIDHKITVLSVSHDINQIIGLCQKAVFIKEGKILYSGKLDEVINESVLGEVFDVKSVVNKAENKLNYVNFYGINN